MEHMQCEAHIAKDGVVFTFIPTHSGPTHLHIGDADCLDGHVQQPAPELTKPRCVRWSQSGSLLGYVTARSRVHTDDVPRSTGLERLGWARAIHRAHRASSFVAKNGGLSLLIRWDLGGEKGVW